MKKNSALLFVILLGVALSACGMNAEQPESADTVQTNGQTTRTENRDVSVQDTGGKGTDEAVPEKLNEVEDNKMKIQVEEYVFTATLEDNSSTDALKEVLQEGPLTIDMQDYENMEKVGPLGRDLPRNDEQITTQPGDLILFQGNAFVIYYAPNSWNFTRIGKIDNVTQEELKEALGNGDVKVTLSLD
jgi:hypothetical protein